jgi:hypothetical protein
VLTFNKQLDWSSAIDAGHYQYFLPGQGHIAVPSGTTVFLEGDGMTVVITFPAGGWAVSGSQVAANAFTLYVATNGTDEMRVLDVTDTNGNAMAPRLIDVPGTSEIAAPLLPNAYATSTQRIMMRFDSSGALPINASSQDFIVKAGSQNLPFRNMSNSNINTSSRELYIELDGVELNADGTYGTQHNAVTVAMVAANLVGYTKTALGTPLEIKGGVTVTVTDNIKPGLLEAFRGSRAAGPSSYLQNVMYPALTQNQILIVFNEPVQMQGGSSGKYLTGVLNVKLENQPDNWLSPGQFTVEALDALNNQTGGSNSPNTHMLLVTLQNATFDAVNVYVSAFMLWDGNVDAYNSSIMNNPFETGYLPAY